MRITLLKSQTDKPTLMIVNKVENQWGQYKWGKFFLSSPFFLPERFFWSEARKKFDPA